MSTHDTPPDCVPDEFPDIGDRTVTLTLDAHECHLIQGAAMHVSLMHGFHGCQKEQTADNLLDKINEAIQAQIKGR